MQDLTADAAPTFAQGYGGQARAPVTGLVQPEIRVWFNPRLESRDFMIPGIVALLLLSVVVFGLSRLSARSSS